ncbi:MAG: response regulator transcription factor [Peptostreptococcaceae bacterium]
MRILIVEDEYITRNFFSSIINWEENNMTLVSLAKDGVEALNIIEKESIDLVLTDLKMPKMDGNTLIKRLNENKFEGKIVVISNYDDFSLVKEAMKNGAFDYILKVTINKDELLKVLEKARLELIKDKKLIKDDNIVEISSEKLKVNEYLEKYLKGEKNISIDNALEKKYLTNFNFIYLRAVSTDVDSSEKEAKLSSFISNIINSCVLHVNSKLISVVHIKRNEFGIIIKSNSKVDDINILICNITRNVKMYLNIDFEKIIHKEITKISECHNLIKHEREDDRYILNSNVSKCRKEIKKVIEYINQNLDRKLNLEALSKIVNMNESYLSRIFKEELGITISDYIKKIRLQKSKELLKEKNARIKDVAMSVGINDQLYFSRLFTKTFNITPSEYKEKYNK